MTEEQLYSQAHSTFSYKENSYSFPIFEKNENYNVYFRGLFDRFGSISSSTLIDTTITCTMKFHIPSGYTDFNFFDSLKNKIKELYGINYSQYVMKYGDGHKISIEIKHWDAVDFLNKLYEGSDARYRNDELYPKYLQWATLNANSLKVPSCNFIKMDERAVTPFKKRMSDVGYDLTIINLYKKLGDRTNMYDTGIIVAPNFGYYTKIVPRSSLVKSGYMLSNSMGIIDGTFRGTLKIVLTKVDDSFPDLTLPFCCAQLIIDRHIHYTINEVTLYEELGETSRGGGEFGSTNKI